jgi:gluconokinase
MSAVVGVDIGTTSTKAVAYEPSGETLSREEREYPLRSPLPGRAEQDPEEIFEAVLDTLSAVARAVRERGGSVSGVSFSSAMHALIGLDEDYQPLTPSITYADNRASEQARRINDELDGLALHRRTGTPVHPMSPLAKLLWFREEDATTFRRAAKWVSVKEYVLFRLFGEFLVDHSIASATGLFNLERLDWDGGALDLLELGEDRLSRPVSTTHVVEGLSTELADRLGLDAGTPFVVGASDGTLANLGVGAMSPGMVACSIGTSGAVRTVIPHPRVDREGRLFCYALTEDRWVIGGPVNNGGVALRWLRDEVFTELAEAARRDRRDPYDRMMELAGEAPAGSGGLIFLPYLLGERAPYWNADARAVFFGLTFRHRRENMIRAVLEGVTYQLHAVSRVLEEVAGAPREIRATGNFSRSALWRQIMADVFGQEVVFPESPESSCLGAALLGMKALGIVQSLDVAQEAVKISLRHTSDPGNARVYEDLTQMFARLYHSLEPEFAALAQHQRSA